MSRSGGRRVAFGVAALFAVALVPRPILAIGGEPAPQPERTYELAVTFEPRRSLPLDRSPIVGELDLHVRPDGTITGFYRSEADRVPVPLSGADSPRGAFFDIGQGFGDLRVDGTLSAAGRPPGFSGRAQIGAETYDVETSPCQPADGARSILCQ